ncbi:MAG: RsmB/NOP family class I SAM-dependent RNA methyltransferase [Pseudomonadota bacterium]
MRERPGPQRRTGDRRPGPGRGRPPAEVPGLAPRRGALTLLSAVLDRGQMLDEAGLEGLDGPGRAEAHGLADLALRHLPAIDRRLEAFVATPPPSQGRHILRLMAAEIDLAGTAPHAAVDSAVRLARGNRLTVRLAGLVNAVGRRLAEAPAPETATADPLADAPGWLARRLVADWGEEAARATLAAHGRQPPHDLTPRVAADAEVLAAELDAMLLPSGSLRLAGRPQISRLAGFAEGAWWVQDAAAALPVRLLGDVEGQRVLDLCAAPGAKTLQLAAAGARVTALDANPRRLGRLADNLERCRLAAEIVEADARDWTPGAPFDAILLDAPCSATGTIRRHPDLPHRSDEAGAAAQLATLTDLQAGLLDRAVDWLAPGGRMVFATCSLFRAEGEAQVAALSDRRPGIVLDPLAPDDPALPPGSVTAEGWLRTMPSMLGEIGGLDGFFAARLRRSAG